MKPLLDHFIPLPPFLCAALATTHRPPVLLRDIQRTSGLSRRMVERIDARIDWSGVDADVMSRFALACGVDLVCQKEALKALRRIMRSKRPFPRYAGRRREAFNRKMARLVELRRKTTPATPSHTAPPVQA